jgi:hypothetical protein
MFGAKLHDKAVVGSHLLYAALVLDLVRPPDRLGAEVTYYISSKISILYDNWNT